MQRTMLLLTGVAVAMFGPMALHRVPEMVNNPAAASAPSDPAKANAPAEAAKAQAAKVAAVPTPHAGSVPVVDLAEALRFEVTPGWIMQRWPRVSTGLALPQLQGYRVPLVTGTSESDLVGSLTYYFNPVQQVEQITFTGTTGDVRRLVQLVSTRYGLGRRVANDPGLFIYELPEARGPARSTLKIRPARVLSVNQPRARFEVELVLGRPQEE